MSSVGLLRSYRPNTWFYANKMRIMKKALLFLKILVLVFAPFTYGQDNSGFFAKADTFFKTYVRQGRVAYKDIKSDPVTLNELVTMAETISVSEENTSEYQAFWINGYNLLVIKGIVDNYPIKSPLEVAGFFDKTERKIGGTSITLNTLENKLLRGKFPKEPRFHFVLVCAGLSCPPIINQAYLPSTLDAQLEEQTKKALNDPNFIRIDKNKVKVSQIFEWYKGDFTGDDGDLKDFINLYRTDKLPEDSKISYYPYDWTLNEVL